MLSHLWSINPYERVIPAFWGIWSELLFMMSLNVRYLLIKKNRDCVVQVFISSDQEVPKFRAPKMRRKPDRKKNGHLGQVFYVGYVK